MQTTHPRRFFGCVAALLSTALLTACLGGRVDTGEVPTVLLVSTLAGQPGVYGSTDGSGSAARFGTPVATAVDSFGNIYVADWTQHVIRKITPEGVVSTWAGQAGSAGSADGTGTAARFNYPQGLVADKGGNLYVADRSNNTIRKIDAFGVVTTLAGTAGASGNTNGTGSAARFNGPVSITVDPSGNIYAGEISGNTIRKITSEGVVTTLAGSPNAAGSADGTGPVARFERPLALTTDTSGNVYVADYGNRLIRKITPSGVVTTVAGSAGQTGHVDGMGSAARLTGPIGIAADGQGNLFVSEFDDHTIRKITPGGEVSTIAGKPGTMGFADGAAMNARFSGPVGLAISPDGLMYLATYGGSALRKFEPGYLVEGTVTGLQGTVVLRNSNGDTVAVNSGNSGGFEFPLPLAKDKPYAVTVQTQPAGQTCTVANGSGTVGTERTEVDVSCKANGGSTVSYTLGGTVYNLNGQVELQSLSGEKLTLEANGAFSFNAPVAAGAAYGISVANHPVGQTCLATAGSGTANATVNTVVVNCSNLTYGVSASVSGLSGGSLVLRNNGGDDLSISANGDHSFATPVPFGNAFTVTVQSQPAGQTCTVSSAMGNSASGTVSGDTRLSVQCVTNPVVTYTIGGSVTGITGGTLVLQNNAGDNLNVTADGVFQFATAVAANGAYSVSVLTSPAGFLCNVFPGTAAGTATTNVTDIAVACVPVPPPPMGYSIGGTVNGLIGMGLILQNGSDYLPVFPMFGGGPSPFTFATPVAVGTSYNVIVESQPGAPSPQTCTVTSGGSGTASGNVSDIVIDCN